MESYLHPVEKAIINAGVTGLATCAYYGMNARGTVPVIGATRLCYIAGGIGGITSIANDIVHSYVKPEVSIRKKAEDYESIAIGVGLGAILYNYTMCLANPNLCRDTGIITNSVIGGGSEFTSSFLYNMFVA